MTDMKSNKNQASLSIRGLTVDISTVSGTSRILENVSFDIGQGEILGIVGESGSGKSMTALTVMRLLPRTARIVTGSVEFDNQDILNATELELCNLRGRRIGMVFQDPMTTLDPVVQVGRQIEEAYAIHHPKVSRAAVRARAEEILSLVGVPDAEKRARQYPHQWSGGMRQRAVIAMALVNNPAVLIADEPTTALDATIQAQVLDVLVNARDELGVAIALITHDLGLIAQYASRAVVMYAGRVMEISSTQKLFDDSRHPYTSALVISRPNAQKPGEQLTTIPGRPPALNDLPAGCLFAPRCLSPFKTDICERERPELKPSVDGRLSACHFRDKHHEEKTT